MKLVPFLLTLTLCLNSFPGRTDVPADPFEPTVTREESKLLSRVASEAEQGIPAAISLLLEERGKETGPAVDFTLGNLYFQNQEFEQAENAYRAALEKMPRFRSALLNLGRVHLLQDEPEETIEVYQRLVADGQADAEMLRLLGHAMMMVDEPVGAESAYRQSLLLKPKETEIRIGLAKALLRQGRHAEGQALVREILNREPTNRELWSLQVNALLADEKVEDAIQSLELARRLDSTTDEMMATLGDLWLIKNQPAEALLAYEEAFSTSTLSLERQLRAAEGFLLVENPKGARKILDKAEARVQSSDAVQPAHTYLRLRAELSLLEDEPENAREFLNQLLLSDPLDGEALMTLANLELQTGEIEKALLTAERATRIEGLEAKALLLRARIEVSRGNYTRAIPLLETAQAFEPRDRVGRYLNQVKRLAP